MEIGGQWWYACLQMKFCCLQRVKSNLRVVDEFYSICTRRKLKVNAGKCKVIVFERKEVNVSYFDTPYKMRVPAVGRCEVVLEEETIEEVKELKYLEMVLCRHGGMEGEIRARAMKSRCFIGSLARIMRGRISKDRVFGLGETKPPLLWPFSWKMFSENEASETIR